VLRALASLDTVDVRLARWAETLRGQRPGESARLLDDAVRGAARREPDALRAYLPLLDLPALTEQAGAGCLAEVLEAARADDLEGCLLLLEYPGAAKRQTPEDPVSDPVLAGVSLGHRKTAARGGRGSLLERILKDPDPRVAAEVLRNPRLREAEVLAIASRRPCPPAVFDSIVRTGGWVTRPAIQRAIAFNPYAPPRLASALCVLLASPDLSAVSNDGGLHPGVRDGALQVLRWRRTAERG
jgi:hypothetical protein